MALQQEALQSLVAVCLFAAYIFGSQSSFAPSLCTVIAVGAIQTFSLLNSLGKEHCKKAKMSDDLSMMSSVRACCSEMKALMCVGRVQGVCIVAVSFAIGRFFRSLLCGVSFLQQSSVAFFFGVLACFAVMAWSTWASWSRLDLFGWELANSSSPHSKNYWLEEEDEETREQQEDIGLATLRNCLPTTDLAEECLGAVLDEACCF